MFQYDYSGNKGNKYNMMKSYHDSYEMNNQLPWSEQNLPVGNEALSRRKVRTGTQLAATGTIKTFQPFKK